MLRILRQLNGQRDVIRLGRGDQIRHPHLGQNARAHPADMGLPAQGDHRNPHPHRFAGGGGTIVRKGVEPDIHLVIHFKMFRLGPCPGHQGDTLRRDAVFREHPVIVLPGRLICQLPAFDQKLGTGNLLQNRCPCRDHMPGDLGQIVEGAEGDLSSFQKRRPNRIRSR